jgi:hypothetical protein
MKKFDSYLNDPYFKAVNTLAQRKSHQVFLNTGKGNAISVLSNIFLSSEEEVCLFTDNMKPDVSDDSYYTYVVSEYIKQNKSIFLVVKNNIIPKDAFKFYKIISEAALKKDPRVHWKVADCKLLQKIADEFKGKSLNFCVGDERAIRIETDTKSFKAICSFNEQAMSKKLASIVKSSFN